MKKNLTLFLALLMLFAFVSCGGSKGDYTDLFNNDDMLINQIISNPDDGYFATKPHLVVFDEEAKKATDEKYDFNINELDGLHLLYTIQADAEGEINLDIQCDSDKGFKIVAVNVETKTLTLISSGKISSTKTVEILEGTTYIVAVGDRANGNFQIGQITSDNDFLGIKTNA